MTEPDQDDIVTVSERVGLDHDGVTEVALDGEVAAVDLWGEALDDCALPPVRGQIVGPGRGRVCGACGGQIDTCLIGNGNLPGCW